MSISASSHVAHSDVRIESHSSATRYLVPVGRLLFAAIFLMSVPMHFAQSTYDHAAQQGVPLANVLVPLSGVLELFGALSLLLGYRARIGAVLLALFLVPVTLAIHKFWGIADPMQAQMQQIHFMKNVALLGATLLMMYFGAGPISLDERAGR
ncbi:MAG TPA: DoxX family protein [Polyangiaceae bacterium]|nr:DoxX family protein [Polyangiaceae bacterium]